LLQLDTDRDVNKSWHTPVLSFLNHSEGELSKYYRTNKMAPAYTVSILLGDGRSMENPGERDLHIRFPWVPESWMLRELRATALVTYWPCHSRLSTGGGPRHSGIGDKVGPGWVCPCCQGDEGCTALM